MASCYSKLSQKRDPRESNSMHRSDIAESPAVFPLDAAFLLNGPQHYLAFGK